MKNNNQQSYRIKGWEYIFNKGEKSFTVHSNSEKNTPPILYKYYGLTDNALNAIENGYLYGPHPFQLNDYFDCCKDLILYDNYNEIVKLFNGDTSLEKEYPEECLYNGEFLKCLHETHWQLTYSKMGIISLSSVDDSILMWSHYAQNNGFAIGLKHNKLPFKHFAPFPVRYDDNKEQFSLIKYPIEFAELLQTTVKNRCWSYEKEWRIIAKCENPPMEVFGGTYCGRLMGHKRYFHYPIEAIAIIILGYKFFLTEELQVLSEKLCIIWIDPNGTDKRVKILNFICKHNLRTQLATTNGLNKIGFLDVLIKRDIDNYTIQQISVD